ncbi:DeoR/GlpR family DNA-binding transcription regulator [Carnobacterium gallinarum]|uniref:DeoR/GlpR family DNA-binding transcription regulator n=1 Tax=Carnobacterium gallinarum TaxID=2749 RepID=UPI000551B8B9|nr:DeoR/GlpR family DNA-binding transcription regulator [Carnobacterium gallinarum]
MKLQRIQQIEAYIQKQDSTSLDELCQVFNVSKNTIRRDINQLEKSGKLRKVYGGVVSLTTPLISFENRTVHNKENKEAIALRASSLIHANDIIFIDSGTTTSKILNTVDPNLAFTTLTNNLDIINAAAAMNNVELVLIGKTYKRKTRSFVELDTQKNAIPYNISKAFMTATGVSIANGLTNSDLMEHHIKSIIAEKAKEIYLLVDQSKFDHSTLLTYAPLQKVKAIITTRDMPKEYQEFCQQNNIELLFCN